MSRCPHPAGSHPPQVPVPASRTAAPWLPRATQVALLVYLSPVIVTVFAVGGLVLGLSWIGRTTRDLAGRGPDRSRNRPQFIPLPIATRGRPASSSRSWFDRDFHSSR
jgi:hypothetical protein